MIFMMCVTIVSISFRMPFSFKLNLTGGQVKMTLLRLKNNLSVDISDVLTLSYLFLS